MKAAAGSLRSEYKMNLFLFFIRRRFHGNWFFWREQRAKNRLSVM